MQSVNYTSSHGAVPVKKGPVEWVVDNFPDLLSQCGDRAQTLRRASRKGQVVGVTHAEAMRVFDIWKDWAATRHFMVFKGHYLSWLERHFAGAPTTLIGISVRGSIEGIFGFEEYEGIKQVTIAKHTPSLPAKTLWTIGLQAAGNGRVLCGSTADKLKHDMGFQPLQSWMFDLAAL